MQPLAQGYSVGVCLSCYLWISDQGANAGILADVQILTYILPCSVMALSILLTTRNHFLVSSLPPLHKRALPGLFTFEFFLPMFNVLLDNSAKASVLLLLKTCQSLFFPPWYYFYLFSMSKPAEGKLGSAFCLSLLTSSPSSAQNHTLYLPLQSRTGKNQGCTIHIFPFSGS